jgi:hypothetical protein
MPHFMACPSTTTYIAAVILFLTGIIRLNYHNRNDVWLPYFMLYTFSMTLAGIKWKRFFATLQTFALINIWTALDVECASASDSPVGFTGLL